ncbi:MAG: hypothetical protein PUA81_03375 [Oscillospiraceae bacterium]|nr:hypothetical protein [Oscillospiraceae bacterium]
MSNKKKENKISSLHSADEEEGKIHVSKSVFKTAQEMQISKINEAEEKQRELQRKQEEREKKKRDAYERRLLEEKKELIRLKQGQITESEMISEQPEQKIKLTPWQKIKNFFYQNKWWLGIASVLAALAVFLIYDIVSKERPDSIVMVVTQNEELNNCTGLADYFEQFTSDSNGNGEILTTVHYIPYSDNPQTNYAYGVDTKLTVEFESADAVMVIAGSKLSDAFVPEDVFTDLSEIYPGNPHVKGCRFYLKGTDFAEKIGVSDDVITEDLYLAIREPVSLMYCDKDEMEKTYNKDFSVFDAVIKDLSQ